MDGSIEIRVDDLPVGVEIEPNDALALLTVVFGLSDAEMLKKAPFLREQDCAIKMRLGDNAFGECVFIQTIPRDGSTVSEYSVSLPDAKQVIKLSGDIKISKTTWEDV